MSEFKKRDIHPVIDFPIFLEEGKLEFQKLIHLRGESPGISFESFDFIKTLGLGAFGRVYLANQRENNSYHAIKILKKKSVVKNKQTKHVINEKRILQTLNFPFTVYLNYAFHDNSFIYFALPFINGGELFTHLRNKEKFEENLAKFYGAQILLALEYLHYCEMIYRDLKPENIMMDDKGYLKLTDFGFCKVVKGRTYTLCGTPEYLAPEIILNKAYGNAVDWWSYGVLLYELSSGYPPFHSKDPMRIYEKIVSGRYKIPSYFSDDLKDLIKNLLQSDLSKRYGNLKNGITDIKGHRWFRSIQWLGVLNYGIEPEYQPQISSIPDTTYFRNYKETILRISSADTFENDFIEF